MGMGRIASSGMDAAMEELDVISNNIANQDTSGFKESSINFADLYPSGGSSNQPGMGVDVSSIQQNFSPMGSTTTGVSTNMAIKGSGFFVVQDPDTGQLVYSRNGAFSFDNTTGNLMLGNQMAQGFPAVNGSIVTGAAPTTLQVNTLPVPAVASTAVTQTGVNVSSSDKVPVDGTFSPTDPKSYNSTSSVTVYDSLGNPSTVNFYYVKGSTDNNWTMYSAIGNTVINSGSPTSLTFNSSGALTSPSTPVALSFSPTTGATAPQNFTVDFSGMTQNGATDATGTFTANGSLPGTFKQVTIDGNGNVSALYSNGTSVLQGQIAIANFPNQQALTYLGNSEWSATSAAGSPSITQQNSTSNITGGALEESNVNVAEQLVQLISAQNAFQANAQAEQVYSQVMQTVTKL